MAKPNFKDAKKASNKKNTFKKDAKFNKADKETRKFKEERGSYDGMCTNDISWYNRMKDLFDRATKIPFNQITGADSRIAECAPALVSPTMRGMTVPAIMSIKYTPGISVCSDYNDAPNRAFQAMYSALLTKTSTSKLEFNASNLALTVMVEQSIAQNLALAKRCVETSNIFTADNLFLPRAWIAAQGFDPDDILENRGAYLWKINNLIRDFNTLNIPNFIDAFKRHYFLAHSYFMDGNTTASQAYVFVPAGYYTYSELGLEDEDGQFDGIARAIWHESAWSTLDELLDVIKQQIRSIRSSLDFTMINGTLNRAFANSEFIKIDELQENATPQILADATMAYQIHNMNVVGYLDMSDHSADIYSNYAEDLLIYKPKVNVNIDSGTANNFILNTFEDSVSPDWIMESTRLITCTNAMHEVVACGLEIVNEINIYYGVYNSQGEMIIESTPGVYYYGGVIREDVINNAWGEALSMLDKFHKAPRFMMVSGTGPIYQGFGITGDLHFYTIASTDAIARLHDTAMLSIFDTNPSMKVK